MTDAPGRRPQKFQDPERTADGQERAQVALRTLEMLWFNTGTACNLACVHCYIESSPRNDRLTFLSATEVAAYLDEVQAGGWPTRRIGFTGGEPFVNPQIVAMLANALGRGYGVLVLTNAMRPMVRHAPALLRLRDEHGERLRLRVSVDHYTPERHEALRGPGSWPAALAGLRWLVASGLSVDVAGRTCWDEDEESLRRGFGELLAGLGVPVDAADPEQLVLFPEMRAEAEVPEVTTRCWNTLGMSPDQVMCASARMVVKRRGAPRPVVVACTLVPYDARFELGERLADATRPVPLCHPYCAQFCVLGGGSCGAGR
ncbi:MAG: radical SAM protein [Candidatus Latescibacterota bacterium]